MARNRNNNKKRNERAKHGEEQKVRTGETFRVLLYVQLKRIFSAGSASTSQRTSIECIFIEPTADCSVPGLHLGASIKPNTNTHTEKKMEHMKSNQIKSPLRESPFGKSFRP